MPEKLYKGLIVEESLEDNSILKDLIILGAQETEEENLADRWHIYTVEATEEDSKKLSLVMKPQKWYAHFWNGRDVIAVFRGKLFAFNYDDKSSWEPATEYGLSVGIPREQLDFLVN